jgi:succinoglycan biosynthesis transport protein ExoP
VDLRRQLAILRSSIRIIIATVVIAAIAAIGVSSVLPRQYEASVTLVVGQSLTSPNPDINQIQASQNLSQTYEAVTTTNKILQSVIDELGLDTTIDALRKQVVADAPRDSSLLNISVTDDSPQRAVQIADTIVEKLLAASESIQGPQVHNQQDVEDDLKAIRGQITQSEKDAAALRNISNRTAIEEQQLLQIEANLTQQRQSYAQVLQSLSSSSNLLSVISPAAASPDPVAPRPLLNALLAVLLGLGVGVGLAYVRATLEDRVGTPEEVEAVAGMSTLGSIVRMHTDNSMDPVYRVATLLYPRSVAAENFRTLRTNLEFAALDRPLRTLLITSSTPGEGKTVVAVNLAVAFAQTGKRTVLVDADLRRPDVHNLLRLSNEQGLSSVLRTTSESPSAMLQATEQPDLHVLTTGPLPPNPAELIGSQRMRNLIDRLVNDTDIVIFDSPPLNSVADAAILASKADGTLFVIDTRRTPTAAVRMASEALSRSGARVLGATLNNRSIDATVGTGYYQRYSESDQQSGLAGGASTVEGRG